MAKRYIVDVRDLTPEEREAVRDRLEGWAFMVCNQYRGDFELIAFEVIWDRQEDFLSSSVCPSHCHCFEI